MIDYRKFTVFKTTVNIGNECRDIEAFNLPWIYNQDKQTGFSASMEVVPLEDVLKIINKK